jgi:HAD superfamily hydrolase (TIGR01509 family)
MFWVLPENTETGRGKRMGAIQAVLFDQDGVIIDTERDGHRLAFNKAFRDFGFDVEWDVEFYHELLQVGGGKERIKYYFEKYYTGKKPEDLDGLIKKLHEAKTAAFIEILETMPLRPGIHRFMQEIQARGLKIGICTTSNEKVAHTVAEKMLADISFDVLIAGDMVSRKKPDPEIYLSALKKIGVAPENCLVLEDSSIGVQAAKAAGCRVVATVNGYTKDEDLSGADLVISCLGDEQGEKAVFLAGNIPLRKAGIVSLEDIERALA